MKLTVLIVVSLFLGLHANAQNYALIQQQGTHAPYNAGSIGNTIISAPADNVLSAWQTIPFQWDYYGLTVNGYFASDNGYITFDSNETVSYPSNDVIPNISGPNNAIYAFWDDLYLYAGPSGTSADAIRTFNYGSAPNRVHVIQWSKVRQTGTNASLYFSIRLHECGDFDIVWDAHQGNTPTGGTIGWEDQSGNAGADLAGPNFAFWQLGNGQTDDLLLSMHWDGVTNDAELLQSDLNSSALTVGSNTLTGEIRNNGSTPITSYNLHYSIDGGTDQTMQVTGVNIAPFTIDTFYHNVPLNILNGGETHTVCIRLDSLNGQANNDERSCNNEICYEFATINGVSGTKRVLLEEITGAWCPFCPAGTYLKDSIMDANPDQAVGISIHGFQLSLDSMTNNAGHAPFDFTGYPSIMIDRTLIQGDIKEPIATNQHNWGQIVDEQLASYTPVDLNMYHTFDQATRELTVHLSAEFVDYASGDMRLVLAITEDSIAGVGPGRAQANAFNNTPGHPYEGAGHPITNFKHNQVLRSNPAGVFGNHGIIPLEVSPGETYSESFSYIVPDEYVWENISIVGFAARYSLVPGKREVLNVIKQQSEEASSAEINEEMIFKDMKVYPNPSEGNFTILLNLSNQTEAEIVLYSSYGEVVQTLESKEFQSGQNEISIDLENQSNGIYYAVIRTPYESITRKIVIR